MARLKYIVRADEQTTAMVLGLLYPATWHRADGTIRPHGGASYKTETFNVFLISFLSHFYERRIYWRYYALSAAFQRTVPPHTTPTNAGTQPYIIKFYTPGLQG
jgi:hypothetical protein